MLTGLPDLSQATQALPSRCHSLQSRPDIACVASLQLEKWSETGTGIYTGHCGEGRVPSFEDANLEESA